LKLDVRKDWTILQMRETINKLYGIRNFDLKVGIEILLDAKTCEESGLKDNITIQLVLK
jgi:hypothetical protein